ncbi:MAG: hypothetical protein PHD61_04020 [Bacteroidales bacterium]|nr:hypothetical protein [Lentimicrobiaceae bacterium]MDD5694455.1 hypothetical protein [Bacteroidales bacterium]
MEKEVQLLKKLVEKLDDKNFNLDAWKSSAMIILARIFGENSQKLRQIEKIEYDYSSWSMRDTRGISYIQTCKKLGRQILETTILELETLGLPPVESPKDVTFDAQPVIQAFEEVLTASQSREVRALLQSTEEDEVIRLNLIDKFKVLGLEVAPKILANILLNKEIRGRM